jgi:hypothetical protein
MASVAHRGEEEMNRTSEYILDRKDQEIKELRAQLEMTREEYSKHHVEVMIAEIALALVCFFVGYLVGSLDLFSRT